MRARSLTVMAIGALLGWAADASAAGFAVADQGASATGIANAATARLDLPEAAYFNPAAYSFTPGTRASVGSLFVFPNLTHTSSTRVSTAAQTEASFVPHLHAGHTFQEPRLSVVGYVGVPFGSGIAWDDDWTGRFEVTQLTLQVFETGLNVGYGFEVGQVAIGIAAGPRFLASEVELRRRVDAVDSEGTVRIVGDGTAVSGQASIAIFTPFASLGVNYRPRATIDYEGDADFEEIPVELAGRARDQPVSTSITLPDRIAIGLSSVLFGRFTLSLDAEMFLWSTFEDFGIDFRSPETPDVTQARNWSNTVAWRGGLEADLGLWGTVFRAGLAWDPTPSPSETLSPTSPDSSRTILAAGAGWRSNFGLAVDAGLAHVVLSDTESTGDAFPGEYSGAANLLNVDVSYHF